MCKDRNLMEHTMLIHQMHLLMHHHHTTTNHPHHSVTMRAVAMAITAIMAVVMAMAVVMTVMTAAAKVNARVLMTTNPAVIMLAVMRYHSGSVVLKISYVFFGAK